MLQLSALEGGMTHELWLFQAAAFLFSIPTIPMTRPITPPFTSSCGLCRSLPAPAGLEITSGPSPFDHAFVSVSELVFTELMDIFLVLLAKGYSLRLKTVPVADGGTHGTRTIFFLPATPFCTNPEWLNNIFSDLISSKVPTKKGGLLVVDQTAQAERRQPISRLGFSSMMRTLRTRLEYVHHTRWT
jgi:hypothetical protein